MRNTCQRSLSFPTHQLPNFSPISTPPLPLLPPTARDPLQPPSPSPTPSGHKQLMQPQHQRGQRAGTRAWKQLSVATGKMGEEVRGRLVSGIAVCGICSVVAGEVGRYTCNKKTATSTSHSELLCIVPVAAQTINHGYHSLWSPQASRHWWSHARSPQEA